MNQLNAIGNLGADPETRFTKSGKAVSSFRMAITSGWGDNEKTTWINCVVWGREDKPHGLIPYLQKGTKVGITGEIVLREFDRNDGTKGQSLDVIVRNFQPLSGQRDPDQAQRSPAESMPEKMTAEEIHNGGMDDDIPF
jgi:single-strand DNA-binding protein